MPAVIAISVNGVAQTPSSIITMGGQQVDVGGFGFVKANAGDQVILTWTGSPIATVVWTLKFFPNAPQFPNVGSIAVFVPGGTWSPGANAFTWTNSNKVASAFTMPAFWARSILSVTSNGVLQFPIVGLVQSTG